MLIQSNAPPLNRLAMVMRSLRRSWRPHRPIPMDEASLRNEHHAMCSRCDWQREFNETRRANDAATEHGQKAHGDPCCCFIRIQAR